MKKLLSILFLSLVLVSCGKEYSFPNVGDTTLEMFSDVDSTEVLQVEKELRCWEDYSDKCALVFGICGSRDYPNTLNNTYTDCVVDQYRTYTLDFKS